MEVQNSHLNAQEDFPDPVGPHTRDSLLGGKVTVISWSSKGVVGAGASVTGGAAGLRQRIHWSQVRFLGGSGVSFTVGHLKVAFVQPREKVVGVPRDEISSSSKKSFRRLYDS